MKKLEKQVRKTLAQVVGIYCAENLYVSGVRVYYPKLEDGIITVERLGARVELFAAEHVVSTGLSNRAWVVNASGTLVQLTPQQSVDRRVEARDALFARLDAEQAATHTATAARARAATRAIGYSGWLAARQAEEDAIVAGVTGWASRGGLEPVRHDCTVIDAAAAWLLDCAVSGDHQEILTCWLADASQHEIVTLVSREHDGGWQGFLAAYGQANLNNLNK